jgi:hypothetical protein
VSAGAAKVPPEKTPLAANAEPAAATLRKFRLDDVILVLAKSLDGLIS